MVIRIRAVHPGWAVLAALLTLCSLACNRVPPSARSQAAKAVVAGLPVVVERVGQPSPAFGRWLTMWARRYGVSRASLHESICRAVGGIRLDEPLEQVTSKVAGHLVSRGITDQAAQTLASNATEFLVGKAVDIPEWHAANC